MHGSTGLLLLRHLAKEGLLGIQGQSFSVQKYPQPVHFRDVREAFVAVAEGAGHGARELTFMEGYGLLVHARSKLFDKLFRVIFVLEKVLPKEVAPAQDAPLPALFVGSEKTQVRQVPLVESKPWPFRFLLELGGMVVFRGADREELKSELRQYLSNFPQLDVRVTMKVCPDESVVLFTWWFRKMRT